MSRFAALMLSIPLLLTAGSSLAQTEGEALPSNENRPNNEDIERERPPFRETEERNEIESFHSGSLAPEPWHKQDHKLNLDELT